MNMIVDKRKRLSISKIHWSIKSLLIIFIGLISGKLFSMVTSSVNYFTSQYIPAFGLLINLVIFVLLIIVLFKLMCKITHLLYTNHVDIFNLNNYVVDDHMKVNRLHSQIDFKKTIDATRKMRLKSSDKSYKIVFHFDRNRIDSIFKEPKNDKYKIIIDHCKDKQLSKYELLKLLDTIDQAISIENQLTADKIAKEKQGFNDRIKTINENNYNKTFIDMKDYMEKLKRDLE